MGRLIALFGEFAGHCIIRCIFWVITIVGSIIPPVFAANADFPEWPSLLGKQVNDAGLFRDLFYIVVVISILGICNLVYSYSVVEGRSNLWITVVSLVCGAFFLYMLMFGTLHFSRLFVMTSHMNQDALNHDLNIIWFTSAVGLAAEVVIAFRERIFRSSRNPQGRVQEPGGRANVTV
jgi:hypothetical protein